MKKVILASACILALSVGGALAQTQPAPGASSEGNVGPGATKPGATKHMKTTKHMKAGTTTGMGTGAQSSKKGMSSNPSSEGTVGSGTGKKASKQPEGR
jgi:hypothetical protein